MKSIVVIPARYQSSRFPGKPLVSLLGKPMILWVAELSEKAVGKENVYEVAYKVNADIYINVQGDEPLLDPTDIVKAIEEKVRFPQEVINGYCALSDGDDPHSVNIPTLIITEQKQMIYISRQTIPGFKDLTIISKCVFMRLAVRSC
jgi:3-deoxy-manno-octulosonate cytidylyltransferase (CMP-KDO synthetase)